VGAGQGRLAHPPILGVGFTIPANAKLSRDTVAGAG